MARSAGSIHVSDNSVTAINDAIQQLMFLLDELRGEHDSTTIRVGPHTHETTTNHGSGTGGQIDHDDLSNVTTDQHHARDHASRHSNGGGDEVTVENLGTAQTETGKILQPDGSGGLVWNRDTALGFVEGSTQEQPWENIIAGSNITITERASGNAIEIAASGGGSAHDLLDGSQNQDTAASVVNAGDLIYGNSTPAWDDLPIGSDGQVLVVAGGLPSWSNPTLTAVEATDQSNVEASTQEQPWENILAGSNITITELANGNAISIAASGGGSIGTWSHDAPPASAGTLDDEFQDNSSGVPGGWTESDFGSDGTFLERQDGLRITEAGGSVVSGIYKTDPTGDITLWTKFFLPAASSNQILFGIALWQDATSSSGDIYTWCFDSFGHKFSLHLWNAYNSYNTEVSTVSTTNPFWPLKYCYLRVRRSGTTYSFDYSHNGVLWTQQYSSTIAFTPTHLGLAIYGTGAVTQHVIAPFFRSLASDIGVTGVSQGKNI